MDRPVARRLLAGGLLLGLLAEVVLDGPAFGLNIVILVVAALAAGWLLRRRDRAPDPLDAWLPVTAVVLAAFVAIRADPFLALLDTFGAALFLGASLAAFSGLAVTRRSAAVITFMAAWTLEAVVAGTPRVVGLAPARSARVDGRPGPPPDRRTRRGRCKGSRARRPDRDDLRGPVRLGRPDLPPRSDDLLGWEIDLGDGRSDGSCSSPRCAWLSAGLLSIAAFGIPAVERSSLGAQARTTATIAGRHRSAPPRRSSSCS